MKNDNKSEPATKADLTDSLTGLKTELKQDIATLDKKIDSVETRVERIAIEPAKTQADVREIKYDMATKMSTKDDISRVLNAIDKFAAVTENYNPLEVPSQRPMAHKRPKEKTWNAAIC